MHICVISSIGIPDKGKWGGFGTHAEMLLKLLVKQGKVTLITIDSLSEASETMIDGIRVVFMSGIETREVNSNWIRNIREIFDRIHREDPVNCIFSEYYCAYGLQTVSISKNIPIFSFIHNFHLTNLYNTWKEVKDAHSLASYLFKTVPRLVFRMIRYEISFYHKSYRVVSVSKLNATYLHKIYRIPNHKIKVIHNWVDTEKFAPSDSFRRECRRKLNLPDDTLVFLLVGSLWRPKGFHIAIKSFARLVKQIPNTLLMIAGKGRDEENLRRLVTEDESIKEKVHFLGLLNRAELPYLYNSADIFLMPSLLSEGHAYTLIEAMSCGLPVIATKRGGNIETVSDAGILVPPGNVDRLAQAMLGLTQNPEKRKEFSRQARERVLNYFSEEVTQDKLFLLINEIVNKRKVKC